MCENLCGSWINLAGPAVKLREALTHLDQSLRTPDSPRQGETFKKPGRIFLSPQEEEAYVKAFVTKPPLRKPYGFP